MAGNYDGIGMGPGNSQLHDHNDSGRGCNGHNRVHDNAQLAVVGVRLVRMKVRDLGNNQHRQQDETQNGHCRQKAGPEATLGAAFPAESCLRSCQSIVPSGSNLLKTTYSFERFKPGEVAPKFQST
jgi:hypothetical protein